MTEKEIHKKKYFLSQLSILTREIRDNRKLIRNKAEVENSFEQGFYEGQLMGLDSILSKLDLRMIEITKALA